MQAKSRLSASMIMCRFTHHCWSCRSLEASRVHGPKKAAAGSRSEAFAAPAPATPSAVPHSDPASARSDSFHDRWCVGEEESRRQVLRWLGT